MSNQGSPFVAEQVAGLGLSVDELADAWTYVFGRYLVIRQEHIDLAEDGVDYNVLKHNPAVLAGVQAGQAPTFVNPNLDVVYSEAWIAVDEHTPAILDVPAVPAGTYYTAQIVDEWAEITYNVNDRTFPEHPHGTFAICLAGSDPEIPDGRVRLDIPSGKAKLLDARADPRRPRSGRRPAARFLAAVSRYAAGRAGDRHRDVHQRRTTGVGDVHAPTARPGARRRPTAPATPMSSRRA